ncbi:hypothetical protein M4D82_01355 [Streptomyces sp. RerS4]|nr:hypothetical protein M4D82_01355 [Streptomyces sp. RerS4]
MRRLCLALGDRLPLASLTAEGVARVFATAWGESAAATRNRHRSAVRSFSAWASLGDLAAGLDRRAETRPRTPALSPAQLDALWSPAATGIPSVYSGPALDPLRPHSRRHGTTVFSVA